MITTISEAAAASDQNTIRPVCAAPPRSMSSDGQRETSAEMVAGSSISSRASGSADVEASRSIEGGPSARRIES